MHIRFVPIQLIMFIYGNAVLTVSSIREVTDLARQAPMSYGLCQCGTAAVLHHASR